MSASIWTISTVLLSFVAAFCIGRLICDLLRIDARTRAAVGGLLGQVWIGFACVNLCFEITLWIDPTRTRELPWFVHGVAALGAASLILHACRTPFRRRTKLVAKLDSENRIRRRSRSQLGIEVLLLVVALTGCALFATSGLAGVDALEVYQLKARALHAGTLDSLAPRTVGSSHPLLLSSIVAWNAHIHGSVQDAIQVVASISAWLLASLIFARALFGRVSNAVASCATIGFSLWPAWLALAPRGEADSALVACVLAAAVAWTNGGHHARWLAIAFAVAAASAKNEGLAWIAIGGSFYLLGAAPQPSAEPFARRIAWAVTGAMLLALMRWPAMTVRARWGTFVEHVDGISFDLFLDPLYLVSRGAPVLEALGRAGSGPSSGFAAWLWMAAIALALRPARRGCRLALCIGLAWFALVFFGMLCGSYDAAWQAQVAAARVWLQASPWLFIALALGWRAARHGCAGVDFAGDGCARQLGPGGLEPAGQKE